MKTNPRIGHETRHNLDRQLMDWAKIKRERPRQGWLKSVRLALGLSTQRLAEQLNTSNNGILAIEKRENDDRVTLATLKKVASAMDCELVYALIPKQKLSLGGAQNRTLENLVDEAAHEAAAKIVTSVSHSMGLENQGVNKADTDQQIKDLAYELKHKLDPRIWKNFHET